MPQSFFTKHDTNPNDNFGGGGCLATGAAAGEDCEGAWVNFYRVSTEHNASPYAVICERHLKQVLEDLPFLDTQTGGDVLPVRETKRVPIGG
jgi:hypothetical protein